MSNWLWDIGWTKDRGSGDGEETQGLDLRPGRRPRRQRGRDAGLQQGRAEAGGSGTLLPLQWLGKRLIATACAWKAVNLVGMLRVSSMTRVIFSLVLG